MSLSSCARQASRARNQNSAIGRRTVAATMIMVGLPTAPRKPLRAISGASIAQASRVPTASHTPEPAAARTNDWFDGRCCNAKMRPPMDGASSLAATCPRGGAAGRRFGARRLASPSPLAPALGASFGLAVDASAFAFGSGMSGGLANAALFGPAPCAVAGAAGKAALSGAAVPDWTTVLNLGSDFGPLSGIGAAPGAAGFCPPFTGKSGFPRPCAGGRSGVRSPLLGSSKGRAAASCRVLPS
jgi:hypothetical protein